MSTLGLLALLSFASGAAPAADYDAAARDAREILAGLVSADTTNPPGNEARAVAIAAAKLKQAGIAFTTHAFAPGRENLVARLRGDGTAPPLLLLAHLDVVGVQGQTWTSPPHQLVEKDGSLVARGSRDDLGMAALEIETVLLLSRSKARLHRDVVLALTGDEESGGGGLRFLLARHPDLVAGAKLAINEGGGATLGDDGKATFVRVVTAEKTYQDVTLRTRGKTGHTSTPQGVNAIARLARALDRVDRYRFPVRLLPVTRAYFRARAGVEQPDLAAAMRAVADAKDPPADAFAVLDRNPSVSALLRTTCVPTVVSGGTRVNALPAEATANVNCRILPDESPEAVLRALVDAIADPEVEVTLAPEFGAGGQSALEGEPLSALERVARSVYGPAPIVPAMETGATDCRMLRASGVACFGLNPIAATEDDSRRAHGVDERFPAASLRSGVEFLHRLVLELDGVKAGR